MSWELVLGLVLLILVFCVGFIVGSVITQKKLHGVGILCISKEGDAYLQLPDEKALDEVKNGNYALFTVVREDSAKNAPTIME